MFWSFAIAYTFSRLRLFLQTWTSSYSCEMETMAGSLHEKWFGRRPSGPKLETCSAGRIEVGESNNQSSEECSASLVTRLFFGSPFPSNLTTEQSRAGLPCCPIFLVQSWFAFRNWKFWVPSFFEWIFRKWWRQAEVACFWNWKSRVPSFFRMNLSKLIEASRIDAFLKGANNFKRLKERNFNV